MKHTLRFIFSVGLVLVCFSTQAQEITKTDSISKRTQIVGSVPQDPTSSKATLSVWCFGYRNAFCPCIQEDIKLYKGRDYILEEMEGLKFSINAKSFYQTNSDQAYELYKITRDFAGLTGDEIVYDLYTGTGTIAQFVSKKAKKVIGVESVPEAIADAKENAKRNNITNCDFFVGDMKVVFNEHFIAQHGHPDVIITDPPRDGMHAAVIDQILKIAPNKIVYVSCNSATQARDLALMDETYKVTRVRPVDMFPQTHHVENVVLLEKR